MIPTSLSAAPLALLGGSTGSGELLLLFVVVLILFGPRRLPEVARMLGRAMQELRRATNDFRNQIVSLDEDNPPSSKGVMPPKSNWTPQSLSRGSWPPAEGSDSSKAPPTSATDTPVEPPKET